MGSLGSQCVNFFLWGLHGDGGQLAVRGGAGVGACWVGLRGGRISVSVEELRAKYGIGAGSGDGDDDEDEEDEDDEEDDEEDVEDSESPPKKRKVEEAGDDAGDE